MKKYLKAQTSTMRLQAISKAFLAFLYTTIVNLSEDFLMLKTECLPR